MESRATLFIGQYAHGIDGKNRLFLPARFRAKATGSRFILTQGLEHCLFLFPPDAWQSLAGKLDQLPLANKSEERAFKRILLSGASEVEADQQGRILIPQILKEYAQIQREAIILGVLHHVEIWGREFWNAYEKKARLTFEQSAPHLEL